MNPITEYNDYRRYMQDFYEDRKRRSAFTWREFAALAGFVSPTYLKLVCDGKTRLSKPGIQKVADAMELSGFERDYFVLMVGYGNAKTDESKMNFLEQMRQLAKLQKIRLVDAEAFEYYESPVCPIVRELAPLMPGAQPSEIAEKMDYEVSAWRVREALQFLVKAGFLEKKGDAYEQTSKTVRGSTESIPLAIRSMNRELSYMAAKSLDKYDATERHVSGLTMGINEECYEQIVREVDACRKKIIDIANSCTDINQVYRLNLQLFPLSGKVSAKERGKV